MHTTASDGRCSPGELVARASAAGVTVLSVTDHDTVGGCEAAETACHGAGVEFVAGIEITAVRDDLDVHVLGYFIDRHSTVLHTFLVEQRKRRIDRIREIVARLAFAGIHLDADAIVQPGLDDATKSAGRPWVARALVAAGHVATVSEGFERWLSPGRPAFIPRLAAAPDEVFARIHDAGGLASVAHPGPLGHDEWLRDFADAGVDAIEAYHSEHDAVMTARYLAAAAEFNLAVTGGSDYHADEKHGASPGSVSLPRAAYERLKALRARLRRALG